MAIQYKEFIGSCVSNPFKSTEMLSDIIDLGITITKKEFLSQINKDAEENINLLKEIKNYPHDFEYYKTPDEKIYFYTNSGIEYFFMDQIY